MKKAILIISVIILSSVLIASCSNDILNQELDLSKARIVKAELSNKEENLLRALTNRCLIFDILNLNEDHNRVDIWVDLYEDGELKGKRLSMEVGIDDDNRASNRIFLATQAIGSPSSDEKWILAAIDEKGTSSGSVTVKIPEVDGGISSGWLYIDSAEIIEDEIITLGAILINVRSKDEHGSSMVMSSNLLEDDTMFEEHISDYDQAYILRCKFSKEDL